MSEVARMEVFIASDHAGRQLASYLVDSLSSLGATDLASLKGYDLQVRANLPTPDCRVDYSEYANWLCLALKATLGKQLNAELASGALSKEDLTKGIQSKMDSTKSVESKADLTPAKEAQSKIDSTKSVESKIHSTKSIKATSQIPIPRALGILVCSTGQGMAMCANKHAGLRAALCVNKQMARMARLHNDAYILCLGQSLIEEATALEMVSAFLTTHFEGGRHIARLLKFPNQTML